MSVEKTGSRAGLPYKVRWLHDGVHRARRFATAAAADKFDRKVKDLKAAGELHLLDAATLPLPGFARDDLELWTSIHEERAKAWSTPPSVVALAWLREHAPAAVGPPVLCHGDAGPGNFLFADGVVTALLDWEFAHLGDPHDDLAWVTVRNHLLGQPIDIPDAFAAWRSTTGLAIDDARLEHHRVFVLTRMAISCDATIAWKDGVEDDSIRTQVLLRPWLGIAICRALAFAGGTGIELDAVTAAAEAAFDASPHAGLLALIPPLEPFALGDR
jgi:aminoglycoside phosphotransferase (APT) family kinase protein